MAVPLISPVEVNLPTDFSYIDKVPFTQAIFVAPKLQGLFTQAIFVAQLNVIFVVPKLHQVLNMFET